MGNDYLSAIATLVDPAKTLVALSASTVMDARTVDLEDIRLVFERWVDEQTQLTKSSQALPLWGDATVAVSGAGAIASEAQEVVIYFASDVALQTVNSDEHVSAGLTALFLKRVEPGSDQWRLTVDELNHSEI